MPIPDYQSLMLPVLRSAQNGEVRIAHVVNKLGNELGLTDEERAELLPSGKQTIAVSTASCEKEEVVTNNPLSSFEPIEAAEEVANVARSDIITRQSLTASVSDLEMGASGAF